MTPPVEAQFIRSIDCRFPYRDRAAAERIIREGAALSANAAFHVLYEICVVPKSARAPGLHDLQRDLLAYWRSNTAHPLVAVIVEAASAIIDVRPLALERARTIMRDVETHTGLLAALSIVTYSVGAAATDAIDEDARRVERAWRST